LVEPLVERRAGGGVGAAAWPAGAADGPATAPGSTAHGRGAPAAATAPAPASRCPSFWLLPTDHTNQPRGPVHRPVRASRSRRQCSAGRARPGRDAGPDQPGRTTCRPASNGPAPPASATGGRPTAKLLRDQELRSPSRARRWVRRGRGLLGRQEGLSLEPYRMPVGGTAPSLTRRPLGRQQQHLVRCLDIAPGDPRLLARWLPGAAPERRRRPCHRAGVGHVGPRVG
jgi:hypothetical protein